MSLRMMAKWEVILWKKQTELDKMIEYYEYISDICWELVHLQEYNRDICFPSYYFITNEKGIEEKKSLHNETCLLARAMRCFINICILCGKKNKKYMKDRYMKKPKNDR